MNILEVQNLCKTYGSGEAEVNALNQVSFSVRKGGIYRHHRGIRLRQKYIAEHCGRA